MAEGPKLSLCIPTHHGRAPLLAELLDSIAGQVGDLPEGTLELCVSDNASNDGTADLVAKFAKTFKYPVVYQRNSRNLGVGPNIYAAAELASGEFIWFVGSDDHIAPDGVDSVLRLLAVYPDVSGAALGASIRTFEDTSVRLEPFVPEFFPDTDQVTVFRGRDRVLEQCGMAWGFLSSVVVRRDLWLDAVAPNRERALKHADWPHIVPLTEVVTRAPVWAWNPRQVILCRGGRSYVFEGDAETAAVHGDLIGGLGTAWSDALGDHGPVYLEIMRRGHAMIGDARLVRTIKAIPATGLHGDLDLLRGLVPALWRVPEFRRRTLPSLLVPARVQRGMTAWRARRAGPSLPEPPERLRISARADLPATVNAGTGFRVDCLVRNEGKVAAKSTEPNPVQVGYQWFSADSGELVEIVGLRSRFRRALRPGASVLLPLNVLVPELPGTYLLRVAAVQEHVRWLDSLEPELGSAREVRVEQVRIGDQQRTEAART